MKKISEIAEENRKEWENNPELQKEIEESVDKAFRKIWLYAYTRVSTKKQMKAGTMENQIRAINKFIEYNNNKYKIIKWFKDEGVSAFKERPEYNKMLECIKEDKADGVIIAKLDRIGRSVKDLVNTIDLLEEKSKIFIVTNQNLNTSTKEGKLLFHMICAIAEYEAELIKERMQEGIERYVEDGGKLGRKEIKISPEIKRKMIIWYNKGLGFSIIKKLLEIENVKMSPKTVGKYLKRWEVEIRSPTHRKTGEKINYEEE
jgi:DNA invertase Pin-like site-specific DNA recombinase